MPSPRRNRQNRKTGTARTVPCTNRNRTEPNRGGHTAWPKLTVSKEVRNKKTSPPIFPQRGRWCQCTGSRDMAALETALAIGTAIYRSPKPLWARNSQKVSKGSSRASRPGVSKTCRKSPKRPEKESKRCQKGVKISVQGLFRHFFDTPGGVVREDLLETSWGISGLGGVEIPVYGDSNRKTVGNMLYLELGVHTHREFLSAFSPPDIIRAHTSSGGQVWF